MLTGRLNRDVARKLWMLVVAGYALALPLPAVAAEIDALYTVEVPLDLAEPDAREAAYGRALDEVLIRITGSESVAESEDLRSLFPNPARYVLQFRPGEDGSLIVSLDGPAIEQLLRRAGVAVWGNDRPLTLVWLAVDWGMGEREIIATDDQEAVPGASRSIDRNRLLRERVKAVAERRGVPVLFPLVDAEDRQNVGFGDIWGGFDEQVLEASRRYGATSVLVGRVRAGEMLDNRWSHHFGGQVRQWTGSPEMAVNMLADALAERFAFAGNAPVQTVALTISGVDSVTAYGVVQRLLDNLSVVDSYVIDTVSGSDMRFQVRVQGGAARLATALEFSSVLERSDWLDAGNLYGTAPAAEALEFRFRPYQPEGDEGRGDGPAGAPQAGSN